MKPPQTFRFGGQKWNLELVAGLKRKGKELLGDCDYTHSKIRVVTDQSTESFRSTLLHECVHAQAHAMDWDAKEGTVIKVEKLIYGLLRDNPSLFRWLLAKTMDCPVCGKPAGTCNCHDAK